MAAFGEEPERLVVLEIVQADGAVVAVNQSVAVSILERRDGVDHGLREADGADEPDGMIQDRDLVLVGEARRRSLRRRRVSSAPRVPVSGDREI